MHARGWALSVCVELLSYQVNEYQQNITRIHEFQKFIGYNLDESETLFPCIDVSIHSTGTSGKVEVSGAIYNFI